MGQIKKSCFKNLRHVPLVPSLHSPTHSSTHLHLLRLPRGRHCAGHWKHIKAAPFPQTVQRYEEIQTHGGINSALGIMEASRGTTHLIWTWRRLHEGGDVCVGLGRSLTQTVKLRRETCISRAISWCEGWRCGRRKIISRTMSLPHSKPLNASPYH